MLTKNEKFDLQRVVSSWDVATHSDGKREVAFAREVAKQGMDYAEAAEYGINELGLDRNSLNSAYNQIEKTVSIRYIT